MKLLWLIPIAAYLLGSIPFGLLIAKARGVDIRQKGSGNIGAANVARNAGAIAGILTLALDAGKGYLTVWLAARISHGAIFWIMVAAVLAVCGHMFSIWLGFKGGKGVATGLGVFVAICWQAAVAALALWILIVAFWRYSSLGSIVASAALPVFMYFFYAPGHAPPDVVTGGTLAIVLLIIVKHRSNIERLVQGKEHRMSFKR